ncbi:MAG: ABC transporter ATP-binding protein [Candidatus Lokiarchaeota archaeon]|nr:ABC transporter ATP-binding protein [Candidatus Lokiarchaeota archaeon]
MYDNNSNISSNILVEAKDLSFAYKKNYWILRNINLIIREREIIGLVGDSGSGKTTFAYILKGIIPQVFKGYLKGNVYINGLDIKKTKIANIAKNIGMVFQDLNSQLFSNTVKEEILFGLQNLKLNLAWADEAMNFLDIISLGNEIPMNLSAGQKQRVILASIIATKPKLLILDEPSAHLDYKGKFALISTLKRINSEYDTTILLISQDPWIIGELCNNILYLHNSTIDCIPTKQKIQKSPQWSWIL